MYRWSVYRNILLQPVFIFIRHLVRITHNNAQTDKIQDMNKTQKRINHHTEKER